MRLFNGFIKLLLIVLPVVTLRAQGCSDAGFCSVNALHDSEQDSVTKPQRNQIKLGVSGGLADHSVWVWGSYLEYNREIKKNFGLDIKLAYLSQISSIAQSGALSDVYINGRYKGFKKTLLTAGIKLPLSDGNRTAKGRPLPLDFQPSLGTIDLIAGVVYPYKGFRFTAAIQQPLTQNHNQFLSDAPGMDTAFLGFQSTNGFKRKGDVLLRVVYPIEAGKHWKITPGLLPIYHLGQDRFTDGFGVERKIEGSEGLTLNGTLFLNYQVNTTHSFEMSFGTPFIARVSRPDGLTRKFVLAIEYKFAI